MGPLSVLAEGAFRPLGPRYVLPWLGRDRAVALRGDPNPLVAHFDVAGDRVRITLKGRPAGPGAEGDELERAMDLARGLAAVDDDPRELLRAHRRHPVLGPLLARRVPRLTRTPTVFEAFAEAVIAQLVTSEEAADATRALLRAAGAPVAGTPLRAAPLASAVAAFPAWRMHAIGIGSRRAAVLVMGARRGTALERLATCPPEEAIRRLDSLPGVGPWTANRVARNAFAYADAVPLGDLHAPWIATTALLGVREPSDEGLLRALEPFRPYRARVMMLLDEAFYRGGASLPRRRRPAVAAHRARKT